MLYKSLQWVFMAHFFLLGLGSTSLQAQSSELDPGKIIQRSIRAHGELPENYQLNFRFRDKSYAGEFKGGMYRMSRTFVQEEEKVFEDVLTNDGLTRTLNGSAVEITEERANAYSNSINSVFYFALLPHKLTDEAVQPEYLGKVSSQKGPLHVIKVTFKQEGGGEDYQDEYVYWFNAHNDLLEYLAYNYQTNGGGVRFRAVSERVQANNHFIFNNYTNYKYTDSKVDLFKLLELYQQDQLEQISLINLEEVQLKINP